MPVKISAKGGNRNRFSKKSNLLQAKANEQKIIFKKNSIFATDKLSYYSEIPNSEIDEVICLEKDRIGNEIFYIKLRNQSYNHRISILRKEFKNYFRGEQIFTYFSKLSFRNTFNQVFFAEEKILRIITINNKSSYLIKWAFLPIKYSTWEEEATPQNIEIYQNHNKLMPPQKMQIDIDSIQISDDYEFGPIHIDAVKMIIQKFLQNEKSSHFALLGGVGSIMRKEVISSFIYIREKFNCNYPILFIIDEDLVSIVKIEIENFLGKFCLAVNFDKDEISEIHENGWFYPDTNIPIYQGIVISFDALPFMTDLLEKTKFLFVCADATSNKANFNTINNLLSDFIEDDEIKKPKDEINQLKLIEDYLKISNLNSYLVISLIPYFLHIPTNNIFLDSCCEPSRVCHEEYVICKLSPEQRTKYDNIISNNLEEKNQPLVDSLNLVIDHPSFNHSDFSIEKITESKMLEFIQRSGKILILHEFIKKAIYEDKRTLIITTNELLLNFLQKYFKLNGIQFDIFDGNLSENPLKSQFILSLIEPEGVLPWSSLQLDWIFSLTSFIDPVMRNSDWEFVLSKEFIVKKCTIFRFIVEDTYDPFLTTSSTPSNIEERPLLYCFLKGTFNYPIRLLSQRSRILPYLLCINQPQIRTFTFSPLLNINDIEQDYIGDFEPCMLETAGSIMIPTTSLRIEGDKKGSNFLQYSDQDDKLSNALKVDTREFNFDFSDETVAAIFSAISTVCWGNWDLMVSKMPIEIRPGIMKDVSYLFLDHLLKMSDREYKIAQTFVSKYSLSFDDLLAQNILASIIKFMRRYLANPHNELNSRLDRIEDMMVLTMVLSRCNVKNIPSDIYVPKDLCESLPSGDWNDENDRNLLYAVYSNGYRSFGPDFSRFNLAALSCRFHALIQAYMPEIPAITGLKRVRPNSPTKSQKESDKSTVKISRKSPSMHKKDDQQQRKTLQQPQKVSEELRETEKIEPANDKEQSPPSAKKKYKKNVWTKQQQTSFAQLLIDYGPNLSINDFRSLIPLADKTDKDIVKLKTKLVEYSKSGEYDKYVFSPPPRESLHSSFEFFSELDELNLSDYYYEDQATIKAIKFWGIGLASRSPLLQSALGTSVITKSALQLEIDRIQRRKVSRDGKSKVRFRVKLKYSKGESSSSKSGTRTSKLNDHSKIESSTSKLNDNSKIESDTSKLNDDSKSGDAKSDLPFDTIDGRSVIFPVAVSKGISIISIGHIIPAPEFSNDEFIYPDGYASSCIYNGTELNCLIRSKDNKPLFRVVNPTKRTKMASSGKTPEEAWHKFLVDVLETPPYSFDTWRVPGHELFGLCSPLTKRIIQALPGAAECPLYRPFAFRTPVKELEFSVLSPSNRFSLDAQEEESDGKHVIAAGQTANDYNEAGLVGNDGSSDESDRSGANNDGGEDGSDGNKNEDGAGDAASDDEVVMKPKLDGDIYFDTQRAKKEQSSYKQKVIANNYEYYNDNDENESGLVGGIDSASKNNESDGDDGDYGDYGSYKSHKHKPKKAQKQKEEPKQQVEKKSANSNRYINKPKTSTAAPDTNTNNDSDASKVTNETKATKASNASKVTNATNDTHAISVGKSNKQEALANLDESASSGNEDSNDSEYSINRAYYDRFKAKKLKSKEKIGQKGRIIEKENKSKSEPKLKEPAKLNNKIRLKVNSSKSQGRQDETVFNKKVDDGENLSNRFGIENSASRLLDDSSNSSFYRGSAIDSLDKTDSIDSMPTPPIDISKGTEKVRVKLADFYSSENENENEPEAANQSPPPPPLLGESDKFMNEEEDQISGQKVDSKSAEEEEASENGEEELGPPQNHEQKKQAQKVPRKYNKKKKENSDKNESIYSFYKDSEEDATADEDSDDGEFVTSPPASKQHKATPSPSSLLPQAAPNQAPRKRGRKPKNAAPVEAAAAAASSASSGAQAHRQQPPSQWSFKKRSEFDNSSYKDEDEDEDEQASKNDKLYKYQLKMSDAGRIMRTRSSGSGKKSRRISGAKSGELSSGSGSSGSESEGDGNYLEVESINSAPSRGSSPSKSKDGGNDDADEVRRQLVQRPNFSSRRKKKKEATVYGNWIKSDKKSDDAIEKVDPSLTQSERFSSPSPPPPSRSPNSSTVSKSAYKRQKNADSNSRPELHFNFSLLANRMQEAGGFGNTELSFSSRDLFRHINPAAHPDSFKNELKKFGDSILQNSAEVRDILGFNEQSASGTWKKSVK